MLSGSGQIHAPEPHLAKVTLRANGLEEGKPLAKVIGNRIAPFEWLEYRLRFIDGLAREIFDDRLWIERRPCRLNHPQHLVMSGHLIRVH